MRGEYVGAMKTNLTRADARHRAGLISNVHYDINLDVTGAEQFRSQTTICLLYTSDAADDTASV